MSTRTEKLDDIFQAKSASSGELNLMLLVLLREAGVTAYPLITSTRTNGKMYEDYPLSPTEFHWESQNSTAPHTPVGKRYLDPTSPILLCVRERRRDERGVTMPYTFLGRARCERAERERPMRIVWRLERPMPWGWFEQMKVAAG